MRTQADEDLLIESLVATLERSPAQINGLQESDAELIRLPGGIVLALTTDGIVEEVELGLYEDPYLIGWMTVIASASDLAAVGADPLGILLNYTLTPDAGTAYLERLQAGVHDACREAGLRVLGGDTNFSTHAQYSGTAVGLIPDGPILTRSGCRAGDLLFSSGPLGEGSAFALLRLRHEAEVAFRPVPRSREGALIRHRASCAMDTSDGLLPTLDQLTRVNGLGFELDQALEVVLHPSAHRLALSSELPPWMMLAGPHGEFELIFTLAPEHRRSFLSEARLMGWEPLYLGRVVSDPGVRLVENGFVRKVDTTAIRNLSAASGARVGEYLESLMRIDGAHHDETASEEARS